MTKPYLAPGLPQPMASPDGLDAPFWKGLEQGELVVQKCGDCGTWQWGPEWICHECLSDDLGFEVRAGEGRIFSYERVWHPVHPALIEQGPYLVVLVELSGAGNVRIIGNLLGDPHQEVVIGAPVTAVFEHHRDAEPPFTLLQWTVSAPSP